MFKLLKWVSQCINRKQSQRGGSRRTTGDRFRPGLEVLEGRDMPAPVSGHTVFAHPPTSSLPPSSLILTQPRPVQPTTTDSAIQMMNSALESYYPSLWGACTNTALLNVGNSTNPVYVPWISQLYVGKDVDGGTVFSFYFQEMHAQHTELSVETTANIALLQGGGASASFSVTFYGTPGSDGVYHTYNMNATLSFASFVEYPNGTVGSSTITLSGTYQDIDGHSGTGPTYPIQLPIGGYNG